MMVAFLRYGRDVVAAAAFVGVLAGAAARADDVPYFGPLAGVGSLPAPLNWVLPNYKAAVAPDWRGFTIEPLLSYQTAQFSGAGGRYLRNAQGFTFGAEAGYNFQAGPVVFGPVADLSYSLMRAGASTWLANIDKAEVGWMGSARGRAGENADESGGRRDAMAAARKCDRRCPSRHPELPLSSEEERRRRPVEAAPWVFAPTLTPVRGARDRDAAPRVEVPS